MALKDVLADAVMVIRLSPESDPTDEDYDDAEYLLIRMLRNSEDLMEWLSENSFTMTTGSERDLTRVDL